MICTGVFSVIRRKGVMTLNEILIGVPFNLQHS